MSLTGDPDGPPFRAGISVFDVMAGPARADRRARRAAPAQRDRARPARRGEPAVVGDVRAGQPDGGLHRGRRRPEADGQRAPEPVPLRVDADGGPGHDHHRRQQPAVPVAVRGARDRRRWPTTRGSRRTPTAPATGSSCVRSSLEQLAKWSADDLFVALNKAGVPCGPINDIGAGRRAGRVARARPTGRGGRGRPGGDAGAQPDHVQRCRRPLRAPAAGARRALRRDQGLAAERRRAGAGADDRRGRPDVPDRHRDVDRGHDHPARSGPRATT